MTGAAAAGPPRTDEVAPPAVGVLRHGAAPARWLLRRWFSVTVAGEEHLPRSGAAVVAANHMGFVDGPLMAAFAPRPLHALTKREMFEGVMGTFLGHAGQIPLTRHESDPAAVKQALRVLRDGGLVGIFPEGTRGGGEMTRAEGGAAYLALVTGAPVVPLVFLGTREPGGALNSVPPRGSRLHLQYGAPLPFEAVPWPRRRDRVRRETERLRLALEELLHRALADTGLGLPGPVPPTNEEEKL